MRFAIAVIACALAVADGQYKGYNNFGFANGQYQGQYQAGQYNRYNKFNQNYRPFVTSTPFPLRPTPARATASVSVTPSPVVPVTRVTPAVSIVPAAPAIVPVVRAVSDSRLAETVRVGNEIDPDGSFKYFFETNNGIAAQAEGTPRNFGGNPPVIPDVIQGSFSWVSPEGKTIVVNYVADENGYQPQSDALPVPPPLPPQIARALEYIARTGKN